MSVSVSPSSVSGDGGDVVQMLVVVNATQGAGYSSAYWVRALDAALPGVSYEVESVSVDGLQTYSRSSAGGPLVGHGTSGEWAVLASLPAGSVLVYRVRLTELVASGSVVQSSVSVEWSSHPVTSSAYGVVRNGSSVAAVSTAVSVPGPGLSWNASVDDASVAGAGRVTVGQVVHLRAVVALAEGTLYGSVVSVSLSRSDVLELVEVVSVVATSGSESDVTTSLVGGSGLVSLLNASHWMVDGAAGIVEVQLGDVTNGGVDGDATVEGVEIVVLGVVRRVLVTQLPVMV